MSQVATLTGGAARVLDQPAQAGGTMPVERTAGRRDRRSSDPIDLLARRLDTRVTGAIDPLEIAAVLEADGLNDALARKRYGLEDVFAVAEAVHRRVPLRAANPEVAASRPISPACVARGVLFALPGVYFLALRDLIPSRTVTIVLIAVTIAGWAGSQAMSVVAHMAAGQRGEEGALGLLRASLLAVLVTAVLVGGGGTALLGWPLSITTVALALALYIVSATTLVFVEADVLLATMLAPGAVAAGLDLAANPRGSTSVPVVAAMACSVALVFVAALWSTAAGTDARHLPTRSELLGALPYATYGGLAGILVAAPIITKLATGGQTSALPALGILPLTLSMGFAELELRRYDARVRAVMAREHGLRSFARAAARTLAAATARYLIALLTLSAAVLALVATSRHPLADEVPMMTAYLALGAALFFGLVLTAGGEVRAVTAWLAATIAVLALLRSTFALDPETAFLIACAGLLAGVGLDAFAKVGKVGSHR